MTNNFISHLFQKEINGDNTPKTFKWHVYLLILLPAFYLFIGFYFRQIFGDLSLRTMDPEYMHFSSALSIATGQISNTNIDSPGSLMQILLALIFRLTYLFRNPDIPFFEDAVLNSDLYLSIASTLFISIVSLSIYFAGRSALKITNNLVLALLIQSTPFIQDVIYDMIGRITPEILFPIPLFLLQIALLKNIFSKIESERNNILLFAFAIALGLSLKSTFFALALLPFFVLKGRSNNLKYFAATALLFSVIALQVTFQISRYFKWLKSLLIHDGIYGQGGTNIINISNFKLNILQLLNTEKLFFALFSLFILLTIICLIINKWKVTKYTLISIGISISVFIFTLMMGKQYAYRYFIPALWMLPIMVIVMKEEIQSIANFRYVKSILMSLILVLLFSKIYQQKYSIKLKHETINNQMNARITSRNFVHSLEKESSKLIVSQDYGSPFHEYAIMYSFCWVRPIIENQNKVLNKLFPNVYQYLTWDNSCRQWGEPFNFAAKVKEGKPLYIFIERNDSVLLQRTLDKFEIKSDSLHISTIPVFINEINNEAIYKVEY